MFVLLPLLPIQNMEIIILNFSVQLNIYILVNMMEQQWSTFPLMNNKTWSLKRKFCKHFDVRSNQNGPCKNFYISKSNLTLILIFVCPSLSLEGSHARDAPLLVTLSVVGGPLIPYLLMVLLDTSSLKTTISSATTLHGRHTQTHYNVGNPFFLG